MAKFKVDWSEKKNNDWVVASLTEVKVFENGQEIPTENKLADVSINRTSKKGDVFPAFDEIRPGAEIEGELWTSTANKNYLFPPRKKLEAPQFIKAQRSVNLEKAMEKKEASIGKFQDNKDWSIKVASTMNKAVELATAEYNSHSQSQNTPDFEKSILRWRQWLLENWDVEPTDIPPFK